MDRTSSPINLLDLGNWVANTYQVIVSQEIPVIVVMVSVLSLDGKLIPIPI